MKEQEYPKYEVARGIRYIGELRTIKKKQDSRLQFLYEAFMNSWEAIIEKFTHEHVDMGCITIKLFLTETLLSSQNNIYKFEKFSVEDNGIGLNEANYNRLITLRDESKMMANKGTGRIQFIHFFDETKIQSTYEQKAKSFRDIEVTLSKKDAFLKNNSIVRIDKNEDSSIAESNTKVSFLNPLDDKDKEYYDYLNAEDIRKDLLQHFLALFCENKSKLPNITIQIIHGNQVHENVSISNNDIRQPEKEEQLDIAYSKLDEKNKIIKSEKTESFQLKSFKLPSNELKSNAVYMVSKGATGKAIDLYNLKKDDEINGNRYMFLLSGKYLDESDRDERGNIELIESSEFRKQNESNLFPEEVILIEDIKDETNSKINSLYEELEAKNQEKNKNIDSLKKMFLLNSKTVNSIRKKIKNTDSDEKILKTIYEADSEIEAEKDNRIKEQLKELQSLTPDKTENYQTELQKKVDELVTLIPMQNRTALSKYVARRKLVLDLFDQILKKELEAIKNKKKERIDEKLLHNLIFQQSSESNSPEDSDLWLINEEFIYFKGFSEEKLEDLVYNGKKIFDKEFNEEDKRYLNSLGEKRLTKRPDVLLFPEEGKAIIIEFKAPEVNVSEHLSQIDFYASILRNYTIDDLSVTSFYGYLIGESIEDRDVRGRVSRFEYSPYFKYWFRPSEKVIDFNNKADGFLYTEIIKYSTLLERAKLRNQIFIDKLTKTEK